MTKPPQVVHGDCLEIMRMLPNDSVDSIVTDPPYGLGFMGKAWDALPPGQEWAEECLRVLKPGGHLLAFGGTRTWHRLAVAVEDAGFEIRDSIAWMYGSGFPKSHDVSKGIDKAAGAEREVIGVKASDRPNRHGGHSGSLGGGAYTPAMETAPATDAAKQWSGWGTALKPAFEPVVVARKPLAVGGFSVIGKVEEEIRLRGYQGEITWTSEPANAAAKRNRTHSSSATPPQQSVAVFAKSAGDSGMQPCEPLTANLSELSTRHGGTPTPTSNQPPAAHQQKSSKTTSSTPTETSAPAAAKTTADSSRLTISKEAEPGIAKKQTTRSTSNSAEKAALLDTEPFAGIATGLTGSKAHAHIKRDATGKFEWPSNLPLTYAGSQTTVAANVLAHGTGALNIDASRIGTETVTINTFDNGAKPFGGAVGEAYTSRTQAGRWPANVVLDEHTAEILDTQSGILKTGGGNRASASGGVIYSERAAGPERVFAANEGGASRFFYVAKAPKKERPVVDGVAHATVKPLALMRWLVKLVTPEGGTVLEPFAGSGTTVEACILEGFHCIAIEREEEYLPLIQARIDRQDAA